MKFVTVKNYLSKIVKNYLTFTFFKGMGTRPCYEAGFFRQEECNLNRKIV